jgi:hypothetical protein
VSLAHTEADLARTVDLAADAAREVASRPRERASRPGR